MPRKSFSIAAAALFGVLLATGGAWISLAHLLPDGTPREIVIIGLGIVFVAAFFWLLISQVRNLLGTPKRVWADLLLVGLNFALLVLAFAWMYSMLGILDNTSTPPQTTYSFAACVYYSIVTLTTLGYGDFYPQGAARALAAIEAIAGYLILGILASSAASLISPRERPFRSDDL